MLTSCAAVRPARTHRFACHFISSPVPPYAQQVTAQTMQLISHSVDKSLSDGKRAVSHIVLVGQSWRPHQRRMGSGFISPGVHTPVCSVVAASTKFRMLLQLSKQAVCSCATAPIVDSCCHLRWVGSACIVRLARGRDAPVAASLGRMCTCVTRSVCLAVRGSLSPLLQRIRCRRVLTSGVTERGGRILRPPRVFACTRTIDVVFTLVVLDSKPLSPAFAFDDETVRHSICTLLQHFREYVMQFDMYFQQHAHTSIRHHPVTVM